jgi:cobalamin synthase
MFKSIYHSLSSHKALLAQTALVILFIGALAWGASISIASQNAMLLEQDTALADGNISPQDGGTPLTASPAVATTPVEFTPNQNETDGIIFAGIMLVLIIVIGTLGIIKQRN